MIGSRRIKGVKIKEIVTIAKRRIKYLIIITIIIINLGGEVKAERKAQKERYQTRHISCMSLV